MSSTTSTRIISIYKSRKTILELLSNISYNTDEYESFSMNEIDAMFNSQQLDMLLSQDKTGKKIYVKYYLVSPDQTAKQIRPQVLDDIIEDIFVIENILTKKDTLLVIIDDEPNETILTKVKYLYDNQGIFVVIHNLKRLQFNILNHVLVPKADILTEEETKSFMKKYNVKNPLLQLPEISRFDPQALALCLRPGQICRFIRDSNTALTTEYYRICI